MCRKLNLLIKILPAQKICGVIFPLLFTYEFNYTAPSDALHVQQIPELNNKLPENCIFNKGKTGCGATTLAIENRISTLIAVPTVNLIKNKLPEHADLLGVYGGVTNQEIADYLKTHDR